MTIPARLAEYISLKFLQLDCKQVWRRPSEPAPFPGNFCEERETTTFWIHL
jgi:hypothetical protein